MKSTCRKAEMGGAYKAVMTATIIGAAITIEFSDGKLEIYGHLLSPSMQKFELLAVSTGRPKFFSWTEKAYF